jgi:hypothetical protein
MKFHVLPHEPKLLPIPHTDVITLTPFERESAKGLNPGRAFLFWIFMFIMMAIPSGSGPSMAGVFIPIALVFASVGTTIVVVFTKRRGISDFKRKKAEQSLEDKRSAERANQSEIRRVNEEAETLTRRLTGIYESSLKLAPELLQYLNQTVHILREATVEYNDNAFSPFWDAIENAAKQLASFNDKANQLAQNANEYYRMLEGRKHTFPAFPIEIRTIPDASSLLNEFRRVVRMGQTNHNFADIWELRRIQAVLIAGFRTLGEAVNNLGHTIEFSISYLQQSISSDMARLVEEQIKIREALE